VRVPTVREPKHPGIGRHDVDVLTVESPSTKRSAFSSVLAKSSSQEAPSNVLVVFDLGSHFDDEIHIESGARFVRARVSDEEARDDASDEHDFLPQVVETSRNFEESRNLSR
jgi:hypothetical protein